MPEIVPWLPLSWPGAWKLAINSAAFGPVKLPLNEELATGSPAPLNLPEKVVLPVE